MGSGGSNRMLSLAETAVLIGCATLTLYKRWREWGLEAYRIGGRLKFRERRVESWLEKQRARLGGTGRVL